MAKTASDQKNWIKHGERPSSQDFKAKGDAFYLGDSKIAAGALGTLTTVGGTIPQTAKGKTIAIFGYGSQGHAQAQNLRDSGYSVIVGLDPQRPSAALAKADGLEVVPPAEAAKRADWIQILTPDETQGEFFESEIRAGLTAGKILGVSHGFSVHFKTIVPPQDVDVVMIAASELVR